MLSDKILDEIAEEIAAAITKRVKEKVAKNLRAKDNDLPEFLKTYKERTKPVEKIQPLNPYPYTTETWKVETNENVGMAETSPTTLKLEPCGNVGIMTEMHPSQKLDINESFTYGPECLNPEIKEPELAGTEGIKKKLGYMETLKSDAPVPLVEEN